MDSVEQSTRSHGLLSWCRLSCLRTSPKLIDHAFQNLFFTPCWSSPWKRSSQAPMQMSNMWEFMILLGAAVYGKVCHPMFFDLYSWVILTSDLWPLPFPSPAKHIKVCFRLQHFCWLSAGPRIDMITVKWVSSWPLHFISERLLNDSDKLVIWASAYVIFFISVVFRLNNLFFCHCIIGVFFAYQTFF